VDHKRFTKNEYSNPYTYQCRNRELFLEMRKFIDEAIGLAHKSSVRHRHGAVIVYKGKIIGRGYNKYVTSGRYIMASYYRQHNNTTIHAEIDAIHDVHRSKQYNLSKIFPDSVMIVVRIPPGNEPRYIFEECGDSKPCNKCQPILEKKGLSVVYHS